MDNKTYPFNKVDFLEYTIGNIQLNGNQQWQLIMILQDFVNIASDDNDFVPFAKALLDELEIGEHWWKLQLNR